ncbi:MAG: UDP-galactopyranose mutase [Mesoaciditoga sp.]|uniref:UDP-galactopyranose mutase n=1 Tax=Athalassotoga sp. TaxID=2022597 RepID=UPI000CA89F1D|nr:MAG: UDP-galactopyranose mutase [Mesoaciditoga sp.]HEU23952.1 UDP-galactopyranose mutase [Mesoaciditoga lauensis]
MKYVLVVGAGLGGATAARILAEANYRVFIVEKLGYVGGHSHDEVNEDGILVHTYGPHIFHTKSKDLFDFLSRFTQWHYYQHRVLSYVDGMYVPFPINRDTIAQIFGIELESEMVEGFLKKEVANSTFSNPPLNFEDAVVSQIGRRLYEKFYMNYTRKQWNMEPSKLSAEVAKRIPVRFNRDGRYFSDQYQGLPLYGYTKMIERMLDHPKISVITNCDYFELRSELKPVSTFYTGRLDDFFDRMYGELEYRSLRLEFKTYQKEFFQSAGVINYPNDYDWTRITEFKYMTGQRSDLTTVCYEYPLDKGEPYYIVMDEKNMQRRALYVNEAEKLENTGEFLFIGRLAEYRYYNMDEVVGRAIEKTEEWLRRHL